MKKSTHPLLQLLVMLAMALGLMLFATLVTAPFLILSGGSMSTTALLVTQAVTQLLTFLLPVVLMTVIYYRKEQRAFYRLDFGGQKWLYGLAGVVIMLLLIPLNDWLTEWNDSWNLGRLGELLRSLQEQTEAILKQIVAADTVGGLLANLLVVALVPAVCEEDLPRRHTEPAATLDIGRRPQALGRACGHLVDGRGIGLTILIECLLRLERGVPEAVGLSEDVKLAVEQQEIVVLLGDGTDEVRAHGLLAQLGLQEHGLGGALLTGDGTEHIDIHRQLQGQRVGLREGTLVEAGECALWSEVKRRQIGHLGHLQRSLALLDSDAGRVQVGIVGQHLIDQCLEVRVGEELAPRHLCQRLALGGYVADQVIAERISRILDGLFVFVIQTAAC